MDEKYHIPVQGQMLRQKRDRTFYGLRENKTSEVNRILLNEATLNLQSKGSTTYHLLFAQK